MVWMECRNATGRIVGTNMPAGTNAFWERALAPRLLQGATVIVAAHSNTVKALLKVLDPTIVTDQMFSPLKIPSATPLGNKFQVSSESMCIP